MSKIYDNWERLVSAVIKRQQIWELCHQPSRTPSICSEASSSDSSSSFRSSDHMANNDKFKRIRELGKGRFGTSTLTELGRDVRVSDKDFFAKGTKLVVKKLRSEVKVTEKQFDTVYEKYFRHQNVATPRAYYFSNKATNGNFILNDYHSQGSVYDMLQGTIFPRPCWGSRLKIAIGAARGIAHIHKQCGGMLAHGNITSSNIFLNSQQYGLVSDFGLSGIMIIPGEQGCLDYHASEYEFKNASHESDVYSFGVLLIELLTGRSPKELQGSQKNLHVVAWALSIGPEDWCSKLFDKCIIGLIFCDEIDMFELVQEANVQLSGYLGLRQIFRSLLDSMELEMVKMLHVARRCLATLPGDRPKIFEVILMLDDILRSGQIEYYT